MDVITMAHGSGGSATKQLIDEIFAAEFSNGVLNKMEDSAVVEATERIALTTDSFVIDPLEFKGGDIGRLAVCGTVNDLLMRGAVPKYLTCGFILEEGLDTALLKRTVHSLAATAKEAGVIIAAGDTKVVEGSGGMYINTAGVGLFEKYRDISAANAKAGDVIIVSGNMGDHHACVLSARLEMENGIKSDCAPLCEAVRALDGCEVHTLRDITRGGLATVLKELAQSSGMEFFIEEEKVPVSEEVQKFAAMLGLDAMYMGNEGKMAVIVAKKDAEKALAALKNARYCQDAAVIGTVQNGENGRLVMKTRLGGMREMGILRGEGLPRIC